MSKNIELMRKDYKNAKLDSIGIGDDKCFHFIFKKGKKYFGIKVNSNNFETFNYTERVK